MFLEFPENFYWGSATSSHQVEGNNHNDWSEWEKQNAKRLTKEAESKYAHWLKSWPEIKEQAQNPENYISGRACDHYSRFKEDFNIAKQLNHNAHRFSIEWSRIEPEEGKFNEKEVGHYQEIINTLREKNIEPFITLFHFTSPIWFSEKGGFLNNNSPFYFERFAEKLAGSLRNANFWITLNEPEVYTSLSYSGGIWPPQEKSLFKAGRVYKNLIKSHILAYTKIKTLNPEAKIGAGLNNSYYEAVGYNPISYLIASFMAYFRNRYFLNGIKTHQDFIGLNYYFHDRIKFQFFKPWEILRPASLKKNENKETTDMGWEIYPSGIYYVLKDLKKYNKPIYITENGLANARDEKREKFIKEHLKWIHKAIKESVDVRGYFYWSLLDNFEWDKGFWPGFGLVEIDYKTLERKIRKSAFTYAKICKNNGLEL